MMADYLAFLGVLVMGAIWGGALVFGYYAAGSDEREVRTAPCLWEEAE